MNERERYLRDWKWKALVNTFVEAMEKRDFSGHDIISALKFADIILKERRLKRLEEMEEGLAEMEKKEEIEK